MNDSLASKAAPTSLEIIKAKVLAYHERMNQIADFLYANNAPEELLINKYHEHLEFYIDKKAFANLKTIIDEKDCDSLVVMFGIGDYPDNNSQVTTCILGVDKDRKILAAHKPKLKADNTFADPDLMGEDTWPPPPTGSGLQILASNGEIVPSNYFTLVTPKETLEAYFK